MNKSDIVEALAEKLRFTKRQAEEIVNLIFGSMVEAMLRGERIEIRGWGSFVVKEYGAYVGRNPRTGESIDVKPKKLPFFKVGKELKERVNRGNPSASDEPPLGGGPLPPPPSSSSADF